MALSGRHGAGGSQEPIFAGFVASLLGGDFVRQVGCACGCRHTCKWAGRGLSGPLRLPSTSGGYQWWAPHSCTSRHELSRSQSFHERCTLHSASVGWQGRSVLEWLSDDTTSDRCCTEHRQRSTWCFGFVYRPVRGNGTQLCAATALDQSFMHIHAFIGSHALQKLRKSAATRRAQSAAPPRPAFTESGSLSC